MNKNIIIYNCQSAESLAEHAMKFPWLTCAQEKELINRVKGGDEDALDQLVNSNLRFVCSVAKRYQNMGLTYEELISAGLIGLSVAARRFEPGQGIRFIAYALSFVIKNIRNMIVCNTM